MKNSINDVIGKNDVIIRPEKPEEKREVEKLVRESFWNVYRPGALEHFVLHRLREDERFVPELNVVMEQSGRLIGHSACVRGEVQPDGGGVLPVLVLGPICIANNWKRQGYGKMLLDEVMRRATALGFGAMCFEGNIGFYGHSGFVPASEFGLRYHGMPEGVEADFFLAQELIPGYLAGASGEYAPPEVYLVDEAAAEEFDAGFAPLEKLKLPGQLF